MEPGAVVVLERLWHERGINAVLDGHLFDRQPERHHIVRHGQSIGIAKIDLVLARSYLVVRILHRDPQLLKSVDGGAPVLLGYI